LRNRGVRGILFGNIHLADVREWYETRTTGRGFKHLEPLWRGSPRELIREFLARGYRTLLVSVDLKQGDAGWVGTEFDSALIEKIEARSTVDVCGERGEYHIWKKFIDRTLRMRDA